MKIAKRILMVTALTAAAVSASGCATMGVRAWERDILAKPEMQFDIHAIDHAIDDHVYFSKETSSGGRGFGGGGCGCN